MIEATVGHLLRQGDRGRELLLGRRSGTFGNGLWSAPGGKSNPRESMLDCLAREVREEIGVRINRRTAVHFATIVYHHPALTGRQPWRVHFFNLTSWRGEPEALEGFSEVCWFPLVHLPYEEMMTDMPLWLPSTLADHEGEFLDAEFTYADEALRIVDRHQLKFHEQPVST